MATTTGHLEVGGISSIRLALVFWNNKTHVIRVNVILCEPLLPFIRLQSIPKSDFAGLSHYAGST